MTTLTHGPAPMTAGPRGVLVDTVTMAGRCVRLTTRNVEALLLAILLPVLVMILMVVVFGGAIDTGPGGPDYITYVVPGVILLCTGYGAANTAIGVTQDMTTGVIDRLRSMDVAGVAVLGGHVVASVARNVISTALAIGVAFAIGFRPQAGLLGWAGAIGVLLAFVLALTWVGVAVGVVVRSVDAAGGFTFAMLFLPYLSSAFVPVASMPTWIRPFAEHQPVTPVIETLRGLLAGSPDISTTVLALAWLAGIGAVGLAGAAVAYRRHTDA